MREQLIRYVDLLFAGAANADDIKQEILQNTLDRYDDLIAQGKTPEAAYSLSISGIGDITEILSGSSLQPTKEREPVQNTPEEGKDDKGKRTKQAIAIAMYILCPVPLFIFGNIGSGVLGLCLMFFIIAAATALLILSGGKDREKSSKPPKSGLHKAVSSIIWMVGLGAYFLLSLSTDAWHITWLIFPMIGALQNVADACVDLAQRKTTTYKSILRIVLFGLAALLLAGLLLAGLGIGMFLFQPGGAGSYISGSGSVDADDVTALSIEWASGTITIETADAETIRFSEEGNAANLQEMVYTLQNGTLTISYGKPPLRIGFLPMPEKALTILVPRGWICEKLNIDSASTDAVIRSMMISKADLDSVSNTFLFSNCSVGTIDMDGASNSIQMVGALDSLDCDGVSNTFKAILTTAPSAIDLDGMSNTLDLTLLEDWGFRVNINGLSNDFQSDFVTTTRDGSYIHGNGSFHIDADGMSSSVHICSMNEGCTHIWDHNVCAFCGMEK